jgi:hypothetical protein
VSVPDKIRDEVKELLWEHADKLDWSTLSAADKARQYTNWTETPTIGGRLAAFMDPRQVRVYIKDTLLKAYTRERMADPTRAFRVLGLPPDTACVEEYIKPHGRRLADGRLVAWSKATEWKTTLLALHERAFGNSGALPYGAIFFESATKHPDPQSRSVVEDAAQKLNIQRIVWMD